MAGVFHACYSLYRAGRLLGQNGLDCYIHAGDIGCCEQRAGARSRESAVMRASAASRGLTVCARRIRAFGCALTADLRRHGEPRDDGLDIEGWSSMVADRSREPARRSPQSLLSPPLMLQRTLTTQPWAQGGARRAETRLRTKKAVADLRTDRAAWRTRRLRGIACLAEEVGKSGHDSGVNTVLQKLPERDGGHHLRDRQAVDAGECQRRQFRNR